MLRCCRTKSFSSPQMLNVLSVKFNTAIWFTRNSNTFGTDFCFENSKCTRTESELTDCSTIFNRFHRISKTIVDSENSTCSTVTHCHSLTEQQECKHFRRIFCFANNFQRISSTIGKYFVIQETQIAAISLTVTHSRFM
jgi:hypothetical protein